MRALTRLSVATLLLGLSGCAADPPADMARETPPVHVPAGYDSAVATPLIVLLHGYTLSGEGQDAYMGLSDLVDDYGFLMAAPDGTKENGPDENRFWNASRSCCNFFESEVDKAGLRKNGAVLAADSAAPDAAEMRAMEAEFEQLEHEMKEINTNEEVCVWVS